MKLRFFYFGIVQSLIKFICCDGPINDVPSQKENKIELEASPQLL